MESRFIFNPRWCDAACGDLSKVCDQESAVHRAGRLNSLDEQLSTFFARPPPSMIEPIDARSVAERGVPFVFTATVGM